MNPQQPQSATSPTPATPIPHHQPTRDELVELGMLAIEDANLAEGSSAPVIDDSAVSGAVAPAATPSRAPDIARPQPPAPQMPLTPGEVPAASPATVVQPTQTTPLPPARPSTPQTVDPGPDAWDKAAAAALPSPPSPLAAHPSGIPQVSPADIMEYSANSSQLKSISKLRKVSNLLYAVITLLAIGIVAGGWYIYQMLVNNF